MIGMAVYTTETQSYISGENGFQYDWSFILGWIAVASGFIVTSASGITLLLISRNSHEEILQ